MPCVTLTFCDCAENHVGMEQIGTKSKKGYSLEDLNSAEAFFISKGKKVERINLNNYIHIKDDSGDMSKIIAKILSKKLKPDSGIKDNYPSGYKYNGPRAELLIIRGALNNEESQLLFEELTALEWDRKYWDTRRSKVLNKHARANLCFSKVGKKADYENKLGTIVSYDSLPELSKLKQMVGDSIPDDEELECEGNLYDNVKKNGIGWHGDAERRKVQGVRVGESMPLCFRWYFQGNRVGAQFSTMLNKGDLYIMSDKAVGYDWKRRTIPTLRHSAGADKYTN